MENLFRAHLRSTLEPCVVVIMGVTGDLASRKLIPALYNLSVDGFLPAHFAFAGFARREYTQDAFHELIINSVEKFSRRKPESDEARRGFLAQASFVQSPFDDPAGYQKLKEVLDGIDAQRGVNAVRLFYCASGPEHFEVIARNLSQAGLLSPREDGRERARIIIEKPFGSDLSSAKALNNALSKYLSEKQIYRIDHYLGKETVQNLLVFRFANGIFEPIWNHKYIHHVEISVAETVGVENRAGYFDKAGILRDFVQNHLLQLLALIALEPPVAFDAQAVRDEKVKVLRSVRPLSYNDVINRTVRGQYHTGHILGERVPGYLEEQGVDPHSLTETYAALELRLDNWRWSQTPFFLRVGKRLPKRVTEISVHFHQVPYRLFSGEDVGEMAPDVLSFQIQPDEGISLRISAKPPGPRIQLQRVNMNFSYRTAFGVEPPEAYERLLLDCLRGDPTLFTRDDEIEYAWEILKPIQEVWETRKGRTTPVYPYEAGTWGPREASDLMRASIGQDWKAL